MGEDVKSENDKCPNCQGNIMQRIDDVEEGIKIRLKVFEEETIPVINHFQKKGKMVEIDGAQTIEKVFEDILEKLNDQD
jgi:adenylate kinase